MTRDKGFGLAYLRKEGGGLHPDDPNAPYTMSPDQYKEMLLTYYNSVGIDNVEKEWVSNPTFRDEVLEIYRRNADGGEEIRAKSTRKRRATRNKV
jgi:hypothetical protein